MQATTARACWCRAPGQCELQQEALPALKPNDVLVRATHGAVSRGTESLVLAGRVPASEHARMRCPHMGGSFEFPVKYGYVSVGVVEACGAGYDQGTFTELIYLNRLDHAVSLSTTEFGSTFGMICNSLDVAYDTFGEVRDESGMVYPVVHQFDRFGELQRDLNRRMPLDPQLLVSNSTTCSSR